MTTYSQGGFYIQELGCKVYSSSGFFSEYSVDKIENPIVLKQRLEAIIELVK
jgi:hypothetical protein